MVIRWAACRTWYGTRRSCLRGRRRRFSGRGWRRRPTSTSTTPSPAWEASSAHAYLNPFHSSYFTTPHKDRLTILGLLWHEPWTYRFNNLTQRLLEEFRVPLKWRQLAAAAPQDRDSSAAEVENLIEQWCPRRHGQRAWGVLREAAVCSASYRARPDHVADFVGDDAKPAKHVSDDFGLCWVHEGRHYKELSPVVPQHEQQLEAFRTRYLDLYGKLQEYQVTPTPAMAERLQEEFRLTVRDTDGVRGIG